MNITMSAKTLILMLFVCASISHLARAEPSPGDVKFAVTDRYKVGGEGGWDLITLDAKRHRLFISRSTHVQVVDTDSGKVVGDIPGTDGVHAIALAEDLDVGFTSNGKSNSVTVFDLTSLKVLDTIHVSGMNPDVILYEPKSKQVFTFNGRSKDATVIDAISHQEVTTIRLSGKPELAVSNDAGNVFVNIEDSSEIAVIDSSSNKIVKVFPLGDGVEPTGLSIDKAHSRLFSVCANNKMEILDAVTGRIVAEAPIGFAPDSAAFDAGLGIAFSSNRDGSLTLVSEKDPEHFLVLQNVVTQKGARTMAYDAESHRAYLVTALLGETPLATKEQPDPKPVVLPDSFVVLVVSLTH